MLLPGSCGTTPPISTAQFQCVREACHASLSGTAAGGVKRGQAGELPSGGGGPKRVCVGDPAGKGAVAGWLRDLGMDAHCNAFAAVGQNIIDCCSYVLRTSRASS